MSRKSRLALRKSSGARKRMTSPNRVTRKIRQEDFEGMRLMLARRRRYAAGMAALRAEQAKALSRRADELARLPEPAYLGATTDTPPAFVPEDTAVPEITPRWRLAKHTMPTAVQVRWNESVLARVQERKNRRSGR